VPRNFLSSRRVQKPRERTGPNGPGGRAPALPPWAPALVQAPITEQSTLLQRSRRADRNAYITCYIWSLESRDINKRRTPHKRGAGLIGPKNDFGPLRPMCILMRYGGKFSTTSPAEPKKAQKEGTI